VFEGGRSIEAGDTVLDDRLNLLAKEDMSAALFEKVCRVSREEGIEQIELQRQKGQVVLRLKDKLLFESASAKLTAESHGMLLKIGRLIEKIGMPVEIQGHTDDRPIRTGRFPSNWELSTARAVSVLRYLNRTAGVDVQLLSATGYAEFRPLVPNESETDMARNRRVDLIFNVENE
jgi:chemotaxis protein MotB